MTLLQRFWCWLKIHSPHRETDPATALYWSCRGCGALVPGRVGRRLR